MGKLDTWLLLVDLDGTLWDHLNISELNPPFKRINKTMIIDQGGVAVNLKPDMVDLIKWSRRNNAIVSTLSWNYMDKAIEALKAFKLLDLFDFHAIEYHPNKHLMLRKLLKRIRDAKGIDIDICRIIYIDDRTIHIEKIYEEIGRITFIQAWKDFKDFNEAKELIFKNLNKCS